MATGGEDGYEQEVFGKMTLELLCWSSENKQKPKVYPSRHSTSIVYRHTERDLALWIDRTNRQHAKCNKSLSKKQYGMLEEIGFPFSLCSEASWKASFDKLKQYREVEGHCDVPRRDKKLGRWVAAQRTSFKERTLSKDRIALLESIDFKWNARDNNKNWDEMYAVLKKYKDDNGTCDVPSTYIDTHGKATLANWVKRQRKQYKKALLKDSQVEKLDKLDFAWSFDTTKAKA